MTQEGDYPYEDRVAFSLTASRPSAQTIHFRIPGWAEGAEIFVNGARQAGLAKPGEFAAVHREWKNGDRVELELPLRMRLEAIDAQHAETVALLRGPLVLMAAKESQTAPLPKITRQQLLGVRRVSERQWEAPAADGSVTMLPFTSMGSRPYTTYLKVI